MRTPLIFTAALVLLHACNPPMDPPPSNDGAPLDDRPSVDAIEALDVAPFDSGTMEEDVSVVDVMRDTRRDTAPLCDVTQAFECGTERCTLAQVCARTRTADLCYDTAARDRCLPCSTQTYSALPRDFCLRGVRQYEGTGATGCVVRCE